MGVNETPAARPHARLRRPLGVVKVKTRLENGHFERRGPRRRDGPPPNSRPAREETHERRPHLVAAALAFAPVAAAAEESAPGAAGGAADRRRHGEANEDAKPDVATVSLSIEVEKPTAAEAANENARRARGGDRRAEGGRHRRQGYRHRRPVALSGVESQNQPRTVSAYQATNRIAVRVQPLDKAGALVAQAVANGADYQGIGFDVSDREAREDALRVKAVENAAHRAELYARGAAMKLGPLQSIHADAAQPAFRPLFEAARSCQQPARRISAADRARPDHAERNGLGDLGAGAALSALQPAARNAA